MTDDCSSTAYLPNKEKQYGQQHKGSINQSSFSCICTQIYVLTFGNCFLAFLIYLVSLVVCFYPHSTSWEQLYTLSIQSSLNIVLDVYNYDVYQWTNDMNHNTIQHSSAVINNDDNHDIKVKQTVHNIDEENETIEQRNDSLINDSESNNTSNGMNDDMLNTCASMIDWKSMNTVSSHTCQQIIQVLLIILHIFCTKHTCIIKAMQTRNNC